MANLHSSTTEVCTSHMYVLLNYIMYTTFLITVYSYWPCQLPHGTNSTNCGGFTQPSFARNIIEQKTWAERGFSQRLLWIFPKPTFAKFSSLKPVPEDVNETIGT